jgi:HEAT repeat protein
MRSGLRLLVAVLLTLSPAAAQMPRVVNGKVVPRQVTGDLRRSIDAVVKAQNGPAWIGYSVPMIAGEHRMCCYDSLEQYKAMSGCCGGCRLESDGHSAFFKPMENCKLEPSDSFFVLMRVSEGRIQRVRPLSSDCAIDVGGLTLHWLEKVEAAESVNLLTMFAHEDRSDNSKNRTTKHRASHEAVSAIALHDNPAADAALEKLIAPNQPREVRKQAAFWLGNSRGQRGFEILRTAFRSDADDDFRRGATFALSQSDVPAALDELIHAAREDRSSEVRSQALFWMAQKAGQKVAPTITAAIDKDPDTDVKRKAVFALSQMREDEGVPLLIQVAKTNRNFAVRREAVFWLGQSSDPRALDFIESLLKQ